MQVCVVQCFQTHPEDSLQLSICLTDQLGDSEHVRKWGRGCLKHLQSKKLQGSVSVCIMLTCLSLFAEVESWAMLPGERN